MWEVFKNKMAFTGHALRGSSGEDALQTLEGKLDATTAQGRPRRMWLDDKTMYTAEYLILTNTLKTSSSSMSVESLHCGMSTFYLFLFYL